MGKPNRQDRAAHLAYVLSQPHTRKDAERARQGTRTKKGGNGKPPSVCGKLKAEHALKRAENSCGRSMKLRKRHTKARSGKCRDVTIAVLIGGLS
jgi:hypothetical protein